MKFRNGDEFECYYTKNKKNGMLRMNVKGMTYEGYFNNNIEDLDSATYQSK